MNIMTHFSRLTLTLHHLCRVSCRGKSAPRRKEKAVAISDDCNGFF